MSSQVSLTPSLSSCFISGPRCCMPAGPDLLNACSPLGGLDWLFFYCPCTLLYQSCELDPSPARPITTVPNKGFVSKPTVCHFHPLLSSPLPACLHLSDFQISFIQLYCSYIHLQLSEVIILRSTLPGCSHHHSFLWKPLGMSQCLDL